VPRPILTSLNGDNSWLISFPRPAEERARPGSKAYFHVVSDPWLTGSAKLASPWIMELRTTEPAAVPSGAAVEAVIREIEDAAASAHLIPEGSSPSSPIVDAIFLNFHYPDHLDEATLRTFDPSTLVFATPECAASVRRWNYFTHLTETRDLDPATNSHWPSLHPGGGLPSWLSVFRLPGHSTLNFATAFVYSPSQKKHEVILHSPHGIKATQPPLQSLLSHLPSSSSSSSEDDDTQAITVLAILHGLKDSFSFGVATVLGVMGGLALERAAKPKYWVKSHDAMLGYSGVIAWVAKTNDVARTMKSGLEEEREKGGVERGEGKEPNLVEVGNGGCFVLE
jgi:hypothetical protein